MKSRIDFSFLGTHIALNIGELLPLLFGPYKIMCFLNIKTFIKKSKSINL